MMAPKDDNSLTTRYCACVQRDHAGVIIKEFVIILDYSVLSTWTQYDHKGPCRREAGMSVPGEGEVMMEDAGYNELGTQRKVHKPRNMDSHKELKKQR